MRGKEHFVPIDLFCRFYQNEVAGVARIRIFLKPHIFLLESVLWAHKANDSAHSSAVYARTKCAILYIFADACGRGLGSSLKAADAERYHDAESGEKKWKFLISTSVLVSVHNNATQ